MQKPWEYLREKSFGPVQIGDDFPTLTNSELYVVVVHRINIQRLRCLGNVVRIEEDAPAIRIWCGELWKSSKRFALIMLEYKCFQIRTASLELEWLSQFDQEPIQRIKSCDERLDTIK